MINMAISGGPSTLPPLHLARLGLFAFDAGDALAVEKHRQVTALIPCSISTFRDFVDPDSSPSVQVNPDSQRGRRLRRFFFRCDFGSGFDFRGCLGQGRDLFYSRRVETFGNGAFPVPNFGALVPNLVHLERVVIGKGYSESGGLGGFRGRCLGRDNSSGLPTKQANE